MRNAIRVATLAPRSSAPTAAPAQPVDVGCGRASTSPTAAAASSDVNVAGAGSDTINLDGGRNTTNVRNGATDTVTCRNGGPNLTAFDPGLDTPNATSCASAPRPAGASWRELRRAQPRLVVLSEGDDAHTVETPEEAALRAEAARAVELALSSLPERERRALVRGAGGRYSRAS